MYKTLNLNGHLIQDATDFECWMQNYCGLDQFDCATVSEMYDEKLQASWYEECFKDMEKEKYLYEDYVWAIRNEIVNVIEEMQERLTGKESRKQLASLLDLVESL